MRIRVAWRGVDGRTHSTIRLVKRDAWAELDVLREEIERRDVEVLGTFVEHGSAVDGTEVSIDAAAVN